MCATAANEAAAIAADAAAGFITDVAADLAVAHFRAHPLDRLAEALHFNGFTAQEVERQAHRGATPDAG